MILTLSGHTIEILDTLMIRQSLALASLSEREQKWEISKADMTLETIKVFVKSVDGLTDPSSIETIILDGLEASDMTDIMTHINATAEKATKKKIN